MDGVQLWGYAMSTEILKTEATHIEAVTPMGILQIAIEQGADIDKLTKLMELQERWEGNQARKAFNAAMAKFKENPPKISKNNHVKFGNTEYDHATLSHVVERITESLSAVGISHKWSIQQPDSQIAVSCVLTHELGHSESTTLRAAADTSGAKNAIQAIGSAVTYLQRYTLLAATGLAAGLNNDGEVPVVADKGLEDGEFQRLCGLIEAAGSKEALKAIYLAACADASELKDQAAINGFAKVKDARWKELHATR